MEVSKGDWKLFLEKVPAWQETYMGKLNREYMELLSGEGGDSEKFWKLYERIRSDKHSRGVMLRLSKQNMVWDIMAMLNEEVISVDELAGFSDELKDTVQFLRSRGV